MRNVSTHQIIVKWNNATDQWRLTNMANGKFVQEFYDCPQFLDYFPEADCNKHTLYEVTIRKIGEVL